MKSLTPTLKFLGISILTFVFAACTTSKTASSAGKPSTESSKIVNLYIWGNYVTPEMLADFEKTTGIKVQVSNYASNEELLAKLQAGVSGYDVIVPSDYMIVAMANLKLIQPLDLSKISNFKKLDPRFLNQYFDKGNKVSIPLDWGTTGIAVNTKLYKGQIKGWKDLFENKALSGKFTLLDDVRETLGAALKVQALSLNSKTPEDLAKGKAQLLKIRGEIKGFTSEPLAGLVNSEMAIAHSYSTDALQARAKTNGAIDYVIPQEGCTLWIDNLAIPAGAPHLEEAYKLVDFLVSPKIGAERAEFIFAAPMNKDSIALLPKELQTNKSLFPEDKTLAKCEMLQDLGDQLALWDRIWTEVKAGK